MLLVKNDNANATQLLAYHKRHSKKPVFGKVLSLPFDGSSSETSKHLGWLMS
jgi:hypothetical protein